MAQDNKDDAKAKKKELPETMRMRFNAFLSLKKRIYKRTNTIRQMFVVNWNLILYQIQDDTVYVDDIHDCSKDDGWPVR